ncbi:MAG: nucleotidyltransferase family protein [Ilumatobacteraceae bacterium]
MTSPTPLILLAGGAGRRFGTDAHKLTVVVCGRPVASWAIEGALESQVGPLIIVTGSTAVALPDDLSTDAKSSIARFGAPRFIGNPHWQSGMATSLQAGLAACEGSEAVVVGLADQPCVTPDAWREVAASQSPIAVATYDGHRGNPVRLHAALWPNLPRTGDEGARGLFRSHPELVEEVACSGSAVDVDTRDDIARVEECLSSRKKHR